MMYGTGIPETYFSRNYFFSRVIIGNLDTKYIKMKETESV